MGQHVEPEETTLQASAAVVRGGGRWAGGVVALALAVLVAGTVGVVVSSDNESEDVLVRNDDGSISLLDAETGTSVFDVDDAVATPDRSTLLTTRPNQGNTVLESRDARTGAVTGSTELDGELHVRSVSPAGGAVVLMPGPAGADLYDPEPRTETELTVAYLDERPATQLTLDGNIEPEMLSLDESTLFVLDFVPPTDPTNYYVKKVDLASGEMTATDSIQVDLTSKMAGKARAQVMHPEGTFLFTLYTLPRDRPVHDIEVSPDAERFAFVHVISLDEEWSHCIFLPVPFGTTDEATIGMAISPDGDTVYVGDPAIGQIAEVDTQTLGVTAVHDVDKLRDTGNRASLAVAPDGAVYVSTGFSVVELDPRTFEGVQAWGRTDGEPVTGLSATASMLRIANGGSITLLDRRTGTETGVIRGSGRGTVDLLGPPSGSVVDFPLECAC